ncbi:MAG TPA: hypothetical protein VFX69_15930 [Steroidobacteraceae bacterium]|nr:hypothetical protein [Steroidobacteraceae bacterium]
MSYRIGDAPDAGLYQGNLLNPAVRREIAGLNRLFLERALHPHHRTDAWFGLPAPAVARLAVAPQEARERAAACPIALFEIRLPDAAGPPSVAVDDDTSSSPDFGPEARRAFGVTALGVARSLVEGVPLATRIAFGLDARVEAQLSAMTLSDSYRVAAWPGLIRPRWPGHDRYWSLFADAVTRGDGVHWVYTAGLCLLAQCERQPPTVVHGSRTRDRPAHRRPPAGSAEVPC